MCGPAARTNGPQHAGAPAHASTLKPALIVVRALQVRISCKSFFDTILLLLQRSGLIQIHIIWYKCHGTGAVRAGWAK
jgi:hypothetical protein